MPTVTVYWRPLCGYCMTIKRELDRRGIPFDSVNIWERRAAAEIVKAANGGDELVPTVRVGERYLSNPSIDELLAVLHA